MTRRALLVMAAASVLGAGCNGLRVTEPDALRAAVPEARPGGRLVVGIRAPESVDPALANDAAGRLVASLVCEPLLQLDAVTGRSARGIADAVTVTAQGAGLTIGLRKGVRFHNGKELTAQDVAYALSRLARHDTASPNADLFRPIAGWEQLHAVPAPTDDTEPADRRLAGVRPISKHALEVGLTGRNAEFIRVLATPAAAPVPDKLADRDDQFGEQPVCTGPYRMTKPYRAGDPTIELERFEDYYGRNEAYVNGGRGYPDVIEFRILPDAAAEVREFDAGVLDLAHVPADGVAVAKARGADFAAGMAPRIEFLALPAGDPAFADRAARDVLSNALDRQRLVDEVYGGGRLPATGLVPPVIEAPGAGCPPREPGSGALDALRARPHKLYVNDDFSNRAMADAIARQWRERLLIDVQVVALPWSEYLKRAAGSGGFDGIYRASWEAAAPGPDGFLHPLFHSQSVGHTNLARFNSIDFDRRLERVARREPDEALRLTKYASLEDMACEQASVIPLTFGQSEYLVRRDRVGPASGALFHRATGEPLLREFFIRVEAS